MLTPNLISLLWQKSHYIEAIAFSMAAEDNAKSAQAQFQLVKIKIAQQKFQEAKIMLDGINLDDLPQYHHDKLPAIYDLLIQNEMN